MKFRRLVSIPIIAMFVLLGFVYYATVFIFMKDWFGLESSNGLLNALIFTFLAFLCVFSFIVSVVTDPGYVPPSYVPDVEHSAASDQESKKNSAHVGQCDKCSAHKPPRAHHCKVCRRCVLRMDHHCLWINNCVGYQNYKAFLVLVFYATIGSLYSTVMITGSALQREWDISGKPQLKIFYVACGILMVSLSLAFGTLFGWHVFLISKNMTTIESHETEQAAWLARKSGQSYRHPFNVGVYRNITLILGPNMLTWLYPLAISHLKDGTSFPTPQHSL